MNLQQEPPVPTSPIALPAPTIHVATIDHRHGVNMYAAADRHALLADLAAYCVEWWTERADESVTDHAGLSPQAILEAYFDGHESESYSTSTATLASTSGEASPFADIVEAGQVLHDLVEEAITIHIYADDDEIDEDCGYTAGAAVWSALMPRAVDSAAS